MKQPETVTSRVYQTPPAPDELFGDLFLDVQLSRIFPDSKTFVDCVPLMAPEAILTLYKAQKEKQDFSLKDFVNQHFTVPESITSGFVSDPSMPTSEHIDRLWDVLTRPPDAAVEGSSRLPLPHPYMVPGGRFREIFYWDTYFTMLGLQRAGRIDLIRHMVDNFAYLIDTYGFIPNGNRTYFLTRSQPPVFALMLQLLVETDGPEVWTRYLPQLQQEYTFWMQQAESGQTRAVTLPDGLVLNRYYDPTPRPRAEAYYKEWELTEMARAAGIEPQTLYGHLRAACESGWDFSSRWFGQDETIVNTSAGDLLPVDLNCILYFLEQTLRDVYRQQGQTQEAERFEKRAEDRKMAINQIFWDEHQQFYVDYNLATQQRTTALTLAAAFPLFFRLASSEQAKAVHDRLRADFLKMGGWVTTLVRSGQQWDSPNGWAPLQWIVYKGLMNYGFTETATTGRDRWLALNDRVFRETGKMMEKYNVVDDVLMAGGGAYPNQDGFGWTNGVYLQFMHEKALFQTKAIPE
ncbi:alpha,alpha-trehalase [Larkinella arboricola]|uniref:Alpha,alpha-trehalase n=1 Tax=Larkinella arboricola TaxID=643671 RepID=A0A327X726_LARAB|nr:alpha,alpha-trehalase TreF [Larkinella arboricola]RAK02765.1 alpha,alpha-trehalase [Larkinella arboricola]